MQTVLRVALLYLAYSVLTPPLTFYSFSNDRIRSARALFSISWLT